MGSSKLDERLLQLGNVWFFLNECVKNSSEETLLEGTLPAFFECGENDFEKLP
jgi:hypothetical protein